MIPLDFLNQIAAQKGVSKSELAALELAVEGHTTAVIGEQLGISGDAARKRLSEVYQKFGIVGKGPVKLKKLQQLLVTRYQQALEGGALSTQFPASKPVDWGNAPDVSVFYGRTSELAKLEKRIVEEGHRLLNIYGMAGMGKTTLAVKLAQRLQPHFERVFWRSLYHAPLLTDLLSELIHFLEPSSPNHLPASEPEQIDWVMQYLQQHRCLLVLNGMEAFSQSGNLAGQYRRNYENYGQWIRLLGVIRHKACVLITSQAKNSEVALLEGKTVSVSSFKLLGLDFEAATALLRDKGLTGEKKWPYLITAYAGNPMMLKLVAETIKEVFDGNVRDFLDNSLTTRDVHNFIERILDRTSSLEQQILYVLSAQSAGMPFKQLDTRLDSVSTHELIDALASLKKRSLIESGEQGFILLPLIKEVTQRMMAAEA
ncbi:NB-ARC domain-containing protein [Acaryochloris sp. IP29b_bin.137]|uniref:helix-turn-helix transcriptional regulator n=1 Tax=Acaryochloris sp. IP29b_bin.137 TaxID=2969217 RepID=UPI002619E1A6|nr:NB-ARC domain-containing protein [Acaryochloris sp. IP29b_bin.137]